MTIAIRSYHPSDLYSLYQICLRTGDSGADATNVYQDPELLGHCFAAPYAVLEPDLCFVLTQAGAPCGYILGTRDSTAFAERCDRDWFPVLRSRYRLPAPDDQSEDAGLIRYIHAGKWINPDVAAYPAHLHIDLLPIAQGQGWGRKLVQAFLGRLGELAVPAVHLGVGKNNARAIGFYERVGFHPVKEYERWIAFGMQVPKPSDSSH